MVTRFWLSLSLTALMAGSAAAQDVHSVLQTAATAMGVADMESIHYSGTGWQGMVGQSFAPDRDWPRVNLTSYTRTIDFETMSSREEYVRAQGNNPRRGGGRDAFARAARLQAWWSSTHCRLQAFTRALPERFGRTQWWLP